MSLSDSKTWKLINLCADQFEQIAQLERELAEARKDSERLEWLPQVYSAGLFYRCRTAGDFRQAIDNVKEGIDE